MKQEKYRKQKYRKSGFTLLELLVAILIIGVIAAIAIPQYNRAVNVARVKAFLPTIRALYEARQRCYAVRDKRCIDLDDGDINFDYTEKNCTDKNCFYSNGDYSITTNSTQDTIYYQYKNIININFYGKPTEYLGFHQTATCYQMNGKNDICSSLGGELIIPHPTYTGSNIYSIRF